MNGYRKELKFIVNESLLLDVENRIKAVMHRDKHQKGDFYRIRSIYLDSPSKSCYYENLSGIGTREKYRIRIYDCSDAKISAEIKIRHRETISKMSADISRDALESVILGDFHGMGQHFCGNRTLDKYLVKLQGSMYRPEVIVDYERCAYVYDIGNVRITFDRNVTASREFDRFFDENLLGRPAIEEGKHVLEIKYDEFLPDEIAGLFPGVLLERDSCSKYARCVEAMGL